MVREDVIAALAVIKIAFPYSYKDVSREQAEHVIALWCDIFADYDPAPVLMAVKTIIASDTNQFPPSIGRVRTEADQIITLIKSLGSMGYTIFEYMGDKAKKYPLSVRKQITQSSKAAYRRIYGREFISNAERLQLPIGNAQENITTLKGALIGEDTRQYLGDSSKVQG